jgi:hypothetical protein
LPSQLPVVPAAKGFPDLHHGAALLLYLTRQQCAKCPCSNRLVTSIMPLPSHASNLIRSLRLERKKTMSPLYGADPSPWPTNATKPYTVRQTSIGWAATHTRNPCPCRNQNRPRTAANTRDSRTTSTTLGTRMFASPNTISIAPDRNRPPHGASASQLRSHFSVTNPRGVVGERNAPTEPCATAWRRHLHNMQALTSCWAATCETFAPAAKLSATIAALRALGQIRRRRPSPSSRLLCSAHPRPSANRSRSVIAGYRLLRPHEQLAASLIQPVLDGRIPRADANGS